MASGLLCLAGLAVAGYLTYAHYTTAKVLACSDRGLVDCAKVTTSSYSRVFGVPVSDLGLAFFVVMAALCNPWAWRSASRVVTRVRLLGATGGVLMILWLVYVELFRLDAICLYCTAVHVITVLLFIVVAFASVTTDRLDTADHEEPDAEPVAAVGRVRRGRRQPLFRGHPADPTTSRDESTPTNSDVGGATNLHASDDESRRPTTHSRRPRHPSRTTAPAWSSLSYSASDQSMPASSTVYCETSTAQFTPSNDSAREAGAFLQLRSPLR